MNMIMKNSYPASCICVAISAGLYGKTTRQAPVASRMLFQFRALLLASGLTMGLCFALHAQTATDPDNSKVDNDGDGLIEIWNLEQLDHMRHNLAGTSYKSSAEATGDTRGCGTNAAAAVAAGGTANKCHGYELMANLDFTDTEATGYNPDWDPVVQMAKAEAVRGAGWTPVGDDSDGTGEYPNYLYPNAFSATFEGNGHVVKNLYVNLKSAEYGSFYAGLFGFAEGTLRNVGMTGDYMSVSSAASSSYAGGLVGYAKAGSTITNCYATGDVESSSSGVDSSSSSAGGLAGAVYGTITNCYATGNIESSSSSTDGPVGESSSSSAGGLVGGAGYGSTIKGCCATGDVESSSRFASPDFESSCYSSAGSLVGSSSGTITNCYATGNVTSSSDAGSSSGGLAGYVNGTITSCYAKGMVSGEGDSGGLVGSARSGSTITNCYATGDVSSASLHYSSFAGGLVGYVWYGATIKNGYATGNVNSSTSSTSPLYYDQPQPFSSAGGLLGYFAGAGITLTNCYATGSAISKAPNANNAYASGVFGRADEKAEEKSTVTACYYSGTVKRGTSGSDLTNVAPVEGQYKTGTQLKALTAATSGGWSELNWDFGTTEQLPMLRRYKEDGSGNQVQGELLGGQTVSIGERVAALERLVGGATQSAAADGSVYQRLKQLMAEVEAVRSSIPATPDLSVYALKRDLDAVERRLSTLATDSNGEVTVDLNAYALKTELLGKADAGASYTKQESDDKYALKSELPAAPDLSGYALKSELPEEPDLSGYALKSELPTVPDLSGYALKSELPAAPDLSSKANVGASYTRAESDRKEAALKADLEAEIGALRKALEDLKKQGAGTDASARTTAWMETRIVVRPNPVRDKLIVSSPVSVVATILDSSGQLLLTRQLPRGEQSIDVSGLSSGSYLLILQMEDGTSSTHKFVKQ